MTRIPTRLPRVLCLSLLAGCSAPSNTPSSSGSSETPRVITASRSSETATAGQQLSFEVAATDPDGSALTFDWSANMGTLGSAISDASTSRVTWTAPACAFPTTSPVVRVFVANSSRRGINLDFPVPGLPDCSSKWTAKGSLALVFFPAATALMKNGKVLIVGVPRAETETTYAEVYEPTTGTWSLTGPMRRTDSVMDPIPLSNGKVLSLPRQATTGLTPLVYDPDTNTWSETGSMVLTHGLSHASTRLADGRVLVSGGNANHQERTTAEVYDPATGAWSATGSLSTARSGHVSTLLSDGKVLIMGGADNQQALATAEVYDPATGTWSTTGNMLWARQGHTATLMPNGKVLVTGGYVNTDGSSPEGSAPKEEEYDPAMGTWSATSPMHQSRRSHQAVLLNDGRVMAIGGLSNTSTSTSTRYAVARTAELYDPATRTWSMAEDLPDPNTDGTVTRLTTGQVLVAGGFFPYEQTLSYSRALLYTP